MIRVLWIGSSWDSRAGYAERDELCRPNRESGAPRLSVLAKAEAARPLRGLDRARRARSRTVDSRVVIVVDGARGQEASADRCPPLTIC